MRTLTLGHILFPLGLFFCMTPWASSALALLTGACLAVAFENPFLLRARRLTRPLLSIAIVGLGAGTDLNVVGRAGANGLVFTAVALSCTLLVGWALGRLLKTSHDTSTLINVGTAICGGSAIVAVSAAIRAPQEETSVALGIVFILNACALIIFPPLGHYFLLTQTQFGLWSALAIHDTRSVVGATLQYGSQALEVGTTVKLVRALWIIPVTLLFTKYYSRNSKGGQSVPAKYPWFIVGFLVMSAAVTWLPQYRDFGHQIEWLAKRLLILTLYLIGSGLTRATLRKVGLIPLAHGVALWLIVAGANFLAVRFLVDRLY